MPAGLSPPRTEGSQAAPPEFQSYFSALPSEMSPREPSHLGGMCLSGFYTQEHVHTHVVHACPCVHTCPPGPRAAAAAPPPTTRDSPTHGRCPGSARTRTHPLHGRPGRRRPQPCRSTRSRPLSHRHRHRSHRLHSIWWTRPGAGRGLLSEKCQPPAPGRPAACVQAPTCHLGARLGSPVVSLASPRHPSLARDPCTASPYRTRARARRRSHPNPAHLRPAGAEGCAIDDAALFLGPGLAVRVGGAGVAGGQSIRAGWGEFPAVAKLQHIAHHGLAPRGEVVESVVVKVPAQPADPPLQGQHRAHGAVPGRDTEPGPEARLQATPLPQAAPSKLSGRRAAQGVLQGAGCQVARCLLHPQSLSPVGMERLSAGTREPRAPPPGTDTAPWELGLGLASPSPQQSVSCQTALPGLV